MDDRERTEWLNACHKKYYDALIVRARSHAGKGTLSQDQLEDCVIETLEIAWDRYGRLRHHPSMLGWMTRTVYNKIDSIIARASARGERRAVCVDDESVRQIVDVKETQRLEEWIEREANREIIDRIISTLTQSEKEIFDQVFVQEKKAGQIARETGATLGSIRATIRRIRKKARKLRRNKIFGWMLFLGTFLLVRPII